MDFLLRSGVRVSCNAVCFTRRLPRFGLGIAPKLRSGDDRKRWVVMFASRLADFESFYMLNCCCGNSGWLRMCAKPGTG